MAFRAPEVDAGKLPATSNAYVGWIDIMGVESIMSRSLAISANFMLKFHALANRALPASVDLFPVMDGLYFTSADQDDTKTFVRHLFGGLAQMLIAQKENKHRFLARAGLAYGPVIVGRDVSAGACSEIHAKPDYARTLLMGIPMIQAHLSERNAPPFGCYVDDSARAFAPQNKPPFNELWWSWFEPASVPLARSLRAALDDYFDWCDARSGAIGYDSARIAHHRSMCHQMLPA